VVGKRSWNRRHAGQDPPGYQGPPGSSLFCEDVVQFRLARFVSDGSQMPIARGFPRRNPTISKAAHIPSTETSSLCRSCFGCWHGHNRPSTPIFITISALPCKTFEQELFGHCQLSHCEHGSAACRVRWASPDRRHRVVRLQRFPPELCGPPRTRRSLRSAYLES
jgi:hypothetical protein